MNDEFVELGNIGLYFQTDN